MNDTTNIVRLDYYSMKNRAILGSGYAIPKHCITNEDLEKVVDTSDEWIVQRTGIKTRYVSSDENTSDLGYRAALQAIANAKIDKEEIDAIVVATMTPDHITPSTACLLREKLGIQRNIMAFDINAACSGFVYGLQVVSGLLHEYKTILLVGSETCSKVIDWKDRNTCVLFGDGAGAMIISNTPNEKEFQFFAQSMVDEKQVLIAKGKPLSPTPLQNIEAETSYLFMEGSEVFRFAIKALEESIHEVLKKANKNLDEIDLIIPHQANIRIIRHVAKRLKLEEDKFFINVEKYGNTSAASVAIAFAQAKEEGKLKEGMNIILVGFGAGLTYASSYLEL